MGSTRSKMLLDSCHALMNHGVDRYRRPSRKTLAQELAARKDREAYAQQQVNDMWRTLPKKAGRASSEEAARRYPEEPQENLLYFIEKNAPLLEPWQREIVRIVRKVAQYFYPQRQTQVMNEGWATFWHHHLLNTMYDDGYLSDGTMIEWLKSHTNVDLPATGRAQGVQRHQPVRARLFDVHRLQAHLRTPDRRRPPLVPRHRRLATGCPRSITRCAISRTRVSSVSSCRRG